ncbi:unnamed protein product (macronuclear) [Paramecium tetraurelia]|uniref:UVR domain-containing protein n=1 Tax=Paramecium tetraurelia TaxID=5888 RepID=A0DC57_PARTE|nr:uncharacterized protein GSPATT00015501001 [Paramecium tetraurelia]CAK80624.1 unnamed protein product [Paramecium tetraurelia]|eukprot:XP_001448021.1 hypothetical protein (macronuclear) [Paramecium tetraurelia strain d4-2]
MFNIFKKKEQTQAQTAPPPPPIQQQQQVVQQPQVVPPQQPAPKGSIFKGNVKVKAPPPPQTQEVQQQQMPAPPTYQAQVHQGQSNSDILLPESDAYKQQFNQMETPTPQEDFNVEQKVEAKINVEEVKKKPAGFGFIKKKQPEQPVPTDECLQEQVESQIIYGIQVQQNQEQQVNKLQDYSSQQIYQQNNSAQQIKEQTINDDQSVQLQNSIKQNEKESEQQQQQQQQQLYQQQQQQKQLLQSTMSSSSQIKNNFINKSQFDSNSINAQLDSSYVKQHQMIMEELEYFQNEVNQKKAQIYISQQEIEKRIITYQQKLQECNSCLTELSIEQSVSIQQEQFERAEEIEQSLKVIQNNITQIDNKIKYEEQQYSELQDEKENIRGEEYPFYQETEQKLEEIERLHIKYSDQYKFEGQAQIKKLQQHIEEENERVKIQQIHTEIDSKHLYEEEQHLNQIMDNQTKEYRIEQDQLVNKKSTLESEIAELQLLLNQKKNELQKVNYDLLSTKEKIQQVQQKFNLQLVKVQNKRTKLDDELNSLETERAQIEALEGDNLRQQNEYKNKLEYLSQQLEAIRVKRNELTRKANLVPEQCQQELDVTQKYQEAKKASTEALQELAQVQRQIDELNYKRNMGQTQLQEILIKKSELQKNLPKMIDDKAQLVQNKSFKGAAQINEQIKEAQRQITLYEEKISENQNIETQILKEIDQIEDSFLITQHRYQQLQQNAEICRYFVLELKLQEISQIDYFGLSQLELDIKNEMNQLVNKYQDLIKANRKVSTEYVEQIQDHEEEVNYNKNEEQQEQQNQVEEEQIEQINDLNEKEELQQQENVIEMSEEQRKSYIKHQQYLYWDLQEKMKALDVQVQDFVQKEQYEEADQIQQEMDRLVIKAAVIEKELKQKFNVDRLMPEEEED